MRVLFVWPGVRVSIWDVGTGYRKAFAQILGEESISDYFLDRRFAYHRRALPEERQADIALISKMATENVVSEALYFNADLVFIVSGLNFHSAGLWLLEKARIPTAVLLTESPYEDEYQREWLSSAVAPRVFTNDRFSAEAYGWTFVPHAYDPDVHKPVATAKESDVLLVGTGWPERQAFLERVDWTGIRLCLMGVWPTMTPTSPLWPFLTQEQVKNDELARLYSTSKICLNFHRASTTALSLGPRAYEIAACGAFQLCDARADLSTVFGSSVPMFTTPEDLGQQIRFYLSNDIVRHRLAKASRAAVEKHTFHARAVDILTSLRSSIHSDTKETVAHGTSNPR